MIPLFWKRFIDLENVYGEILGMIIWWIYTNKFEEHWAFLLITPSNFHEDRHTNLMMWSHGIFASV